MPTFITHYLYGVDLYQNMTQMQMKHCIHKHVGAYRLGLQGPDIFFYYPLCMMEPKNKNIGSLMHETKVGEFFKNYLTILKSMNSEAQEIATAYLCGLIAHNTLDASIHPYVYYRAGFQPDSGIPGKYYLGMHGEIETCIDFILLHQVRHMSPSEFHETKAIHLNRKELSVLTQLLSKTLRKTYRGMHLPGMSPIGVILAILCTKLATAVLHSNHGIRKKVIYTIEQTLLHYNIIATTINWNGMIDKYDAMNHSRKAWKNPWNPELVSTETVDDLYQKAKLRYNSLMPLLQDYLLCMPCDKSAKRKPLLKELGNVSYHSGLDCKQS